MTVRLDVLDRGQRLRARTFMRVVRVVTRQRLDPVAQMTLYRPRFFGKPMLAFVSEVLRGPSYWTPAEREFLAVFTSRLNECPFCVRVHTATAVIEARGQIDVDDDGSVRPQLAAVLPLVEKVTRTPDLVVAADMDAARAAGVPDDAIIDALHVSVVFNIMNRLVNAFGFDWDSQAHVELGAKMLHRISYRMPAFLMR